LLQRWREPGMLSQRRPLVEARTELSHRGVDTYRVKRSPR
jgi:hypothetical protein